MEKFEFDNKKIKNFEEKLMGIATDEAYYGAYYLSVNLRTAKLNFVFLVGDHSHKLENIDGALNITLDENGKVVCEEVATNTYDNDVSLPINYLVADFDKIIYNPKYLHYHAIPNDSEKTAKGFAEIIKLLDDRDFKLLFLNNVEKFMKHNINVDKLQNEIDILENKKAQIEKKIRLKQQTITLG